MGAPPRRIAVSVYTPEDRWREAYEEKPTISSDISEKCRSSRIAEEAEWLLSG